MSHETGLGDYLPAIILTLLTLTIFVVLVRKRRETGVNALDWIIAIFGTVFLLGIGQLFKINYHEDVSFFGGDLPIVDGVEPALGNDIVRVLHLIVLIILYLMAEQFLSDKLHSFRLIIFSSLISTYIFLTIYYLTTDTVIYTDEIISGTKNFSTIEHVIFDTIQLFSIALIFYVYLIQFRITDDARLRRYLLIINIAVVVYLVSSLIETLEHFVLNSDVDAFVTAIPTFLILAYFYIRNPQFVYLAPAKIAFLQIVTREGNMLYAAELKEELETSDFLVGPSLTSVNLIIEELVSSERDVIEINKFVYTGGYILFEKVGGIRAILQTDRPARILKRSMRYFLREFDKQFHPQIVDFRGNIKSSEGISPDDLFRKCIPIVASKAITSSYSESA
ncbi:MAG: hypothetical protein ACXAB7_04035 [Candidatus Kariarchaeaceae archaeon]|jgi:hypothetical protein